MRALLEALSFSLDWEKIAQNLHQREVKRFLPLGFLGVWFTLLQQKGYQVLYVARSEIEAEEVYQSVLSVGGRVSFFPEVDVMPYAHVLPSLDKLGDRMRTLARLLEGERDIVIGTPESLGRKLPPPAFFRQSARKIRVGERIDRQEFLEWLGRSHYIREYKVLEPACFSVKGDIVDVFSPHLDEPCRIVFFDDVIEEIKFFDVASQLSREKIEEVTLLPATEFACDWEFPKTKEDEDIAKAHSCFVRGYGRLATFLAYMPQDTIVFTPAEREDLWNAMYHKYMGMENLFWSWQEFAETFSHEWVCEGMGEKDDPLVGIEEAPLYGEGFSLFMESVAHHYLESGYTVVIAVEFEDLAKRLERILKPLGAQRVSRDDGTLPSVGIVVMDYEHGFEWRGGKILLLSESDISGKKRVFRKRLRQMDALLDDLESIAVGDYVVHLNYGIGIFRGVERLSILGKEKDYIHLEYAQGEKLYVPLEQSSLIGKYIGDPSHKPTLDSLGSKSWAKKREAVEKSVAEFAKKLVTLYAKRQSYQGHAFSSDTVWQREFEDKFEYIETPDQIRVIEEIKKDMESPVPMDRLLCGDVGFGKTEVAMRAAFKAVMDGKQVAVVAPTTVLVEQHYYTFTRRFEGFPVKIAFLSRFTERSQEKRILEAVKHHQVDILIGTHKLFSPRVEFHNLGLVVIDEEHKFGVEQKETLKERYPHVDFLSLSATPIPRTLNLALASLRDMSLLQTPPDMRIPVETTVADFSWEIVRYALQQEFRRGGQVYFIHNTIKNLPEYAYRIQHEVPEARVVIGHGQMEEEMLDHAFMGFVRGEYNVFVSTTIVESGLDIPRANTLIVSDAHRYGLSQLYQLKGRVGRGKELGYAYFLYPGKRFLTENAHKRLFVINEYTDLGAGFQVAMKDLEIRGAGNILGREQHGNILAVGYDLYVKMLREEILRLKGEYKPVVEPLIDLNYTAAIPDSYIQSSMEKMEVYKLMLSVTTEEDIRKLSEILRDRYGPYPADMETLFEIVRLKIRAKHLGISAIVEQKKYIEIRFTNPRVVNVEKLLLMKQTGKHAFELNPSEPSVISYESFEGSVELKVNRLLRFLEDICEI
ncbi:MAG: transcription-repair coupling factor [Brevinematales bacterium]|nr:transcription-repair coupling factor [Brevinematales bacterium]